MDISSPVKPLYTLFTSEPEKTGYIIFCLSNVFFTFNLVGFHVRSLYVT